MNATTRPLILDINPCTDLREIEGLVSGLTATEVAELADAASLLQASANPRWHATLISVLRSARTTAELYWQDAELTAALDRALAVLAAFYPAFNWQHVMLRAGV